MGVVVPLGGIDNRLMVECCQDVPLSLQSLPWGSMLLWFGCGLTDGPDQIDLFLPSPLHLLSHRQIQILPDKRSHHPHHLADMKLQSSDQPGPADLAGYLGGLGKCLPPVRPVLGVAGQTGSRQNFLKSCWSGQQKWADWF